MPIFSRDKQKWHLPLEDAGDEQSNFAAKSKNLDKSKKTIEREFF